MHQRRDGLRMFAGPAEPDQAAPVVDDQHDPPEVERATEALDVLDLALPGAGRVCRRVAETGQVWRDRAAAQIGDRAGRTFRHR